MTKINTFATFLIEQELFEDKVEVILSKQGDKLFQAYKDDKGRAKPKLAEPKDVIDELSGISKEYLQWLVTRYINGQFFLEDKPKIEWIVQNFKKYAKKLEFTDINKYKDIAALEAEMRALDPESIKSNKQISKEEADAQEELFLKKKKAIIYYDEGPIKVIIPKSVEASQYFGKGTRWCTAAENNNMFKTYSRGTDVLYIIVLRGNKNKYQIHFGTKQFMDPEDRPVSPETLIDLCTKYPKLTEIFSTQAKSNEWPVLFMGDALEEKLINTFYDRLTKHNSHRDQEACVVALKYLIDTKQLSSKLREELVEAHTLFSALHTKYGFTSKEFKQITNAVLKTREEKVKSIVINEVESFGNINVEQILNAAEVLGLEKDIDLLVDLIDAIRENRRSNSYTAKNMATLISHFDVPKEFPAKLVKALIAISSNIYADAEFGAENFNRMFPNLPEGDKAKGVVAWAKELNGSKVKFDLIPDKWKSRTNWKPAIKI
jgi:hypothetical protein